MATYKPRVYYELIPDELQGSEPKAQFQTSYKGFSIGKVSPHQLYEITPREGCDLPNMLAGRYTKLSTLKEQIDKYLAEFPTATPETAYVERPKKRGRGRPKKKLATTSLVAERKEPLA